MTIYNIYDLLFHQRLAFLQHSLIKFKIKKILEKYHNNLAGLEMVFTLKSRIVENEFDNE